MVHFRAHLGGTTSFSHFSLAWRVKPLRGVTSPAQVPSGGVKMTPLRTFFAVLREYQHYLGGRSNLLPDKSHPDFVKN